MASRLSALIFVPNGGASANTDWRTGNVPDVLWQQGWAEWYAQSAIPRMVSLGVKNLLIHWPFGEFQPGTEPTTGYAANGGTAVNSVVAARQAVAPLFYDDRLVAGRPGLGQPSFLDFWASTVSVLKSQGVEEVVCYQGLPPVDWPRDNASIDSWYAEIEKAGMTVALDLMGFVDGLSFAVPATLCARRLQARRPSGVLIENLPTSGDTRATSWADGRFGVITGFSTLDLALTTPSDWLAPRGRTVWAFANGGTPAITRLNKAMGYLGQRTNGSPIGVMMELGDMPDDSIRLLLAAAA